MRVHCKAIYILTLLINIIIIYTVILQNEVEVPQNGRRAEPKVQWFFVAGGCAAVVIIIILVLYYSFMLFMEVLRIIGKHYLLPVQSETMITGSMLITALAIIVVGYVFTLIMRRR